MPDEVKLEPCPWCGDAEPTLDSVYSHTLGLLWAVSCTQCERSVEGKDGAKNDAIAAWNALPRKPHRITYDGTEETLPMYGKLTLVETKHGAKFAVYSYDFEIGDCWMPWPEDKHAE